jgi:RimJ/RimL family protein N-acetyltransferase
MRIPQFETARLLLRPFHESDGASVERLAGAPEVAATTLHVPHPYPTGVAARWIATHQESFQKKEAVTWAMVQRDSGEVLGAFSARLHQTDQRSEIGYWIGVPFWGQGYTTEAGLTIREYLFRDWGLQRIFAQHFVGNPASGRVMQKLGMQYEGCLRQHVRKGSQFIDLALYGILRSEWVALTTPN